MLLLTFAHEKLIFIHKSILLNQWLTLPNPVVKLIKNSKCRTYNLNLTFQLLIISVENKKEQKSVRNTTQNIFGR